jgi:hypothetical protein
MNECYRDADDVKSPWGRVVLGGLIAVIVGIVYLAVRGSDNAESVNLPSRKMFNTPFITPGIRQPVTVSAAEAKVDDQVQVIGIRVGKKHRAYVVRAFDRTLWHVVNDLLDDVPVTVTYCDRCDMARAFTSPRRGSPLDVMLGGWLEDRMLLRLGDAFFPQDADEDSLGRGLGSTPERNRNAVPILTEFPHERATWIAWKTAHPDTDAYVGLDEKRRMEQGPMGK